MDGQRFAIGGRVYDAEDPQLQATLEQAHEAPARPAACVGPAALRCMLPIDAST
jgi:hypothetical protein